MRLTGSIDQLTGFPSTAPNLLAGPSIGTSVSGAEFCTTTSSPPTPLHLAHPKDPVTRALRQTNSTSQRGSSALWHHPVPPAASEARAVSPFPPPDFRLQAVRRRRLSLFPSKPPFPSA